MSGKCREVGAVGGEGGGGGGGGGGGRKRTVSRSLCVPRQMVR